MKTIINTIFEATIESEVWNTTCRLLQILNHHFTKTFPTVTINWMHKQTAKSSYKKLFVI